jgi:hypothetical protein
MLSHCADTTEDDPLGRYTSPSPGIGEIEYSTFVVKHGGHRVETHTTEDAVVMTIHTGQNPPSPPPIAFGGTVVAPTPDPPCYCKGDWSKVEEKEGVDRTAEWEDVLNQIKELSPPCHIDADVRGYFKKMSYYVNYVSTRAIECSSIYIGQVTKKEFKELLFKFVERLQKDTVCAMNKDDELTRIIRSLMRDRPPYYNLPAYHAMFTSEGFAASTYGYREKLKEDLKKADERMSVHSFNHSFIHYCDPNCAEKRKRRDDKRKRRGEKRKRRNDKKKRSGMYSIIQSFKIHYCVLCR